MIQPARWRKRQREGGASLFILVQIQAGSPAFAKASAGRASPQAPQDRPNRSKLPVDGRFSGFRRPKIWSKTHPRARETPAHAHDPPKCGRFGAKIMRSFMNGSAIGRKT